MYAVYTGTETEIKKLHDFIFSTVWKKNIRFKDTSNTHFTLLRHILDVSKKHDLNKTTLQYKIEKETKTEESTSIEVQNLSKQCD